MPATISPVSSSACATVSDETKRTGCNGGAAHPVRMINEF
jgi:hypothetical protein